MRLHLFAGLLYEHDADCVHDLLEPMLLGPRIIRKVLPEGREHVPKENANNREDVYLDTTHGVKYFFNLAWHVVEGAKVVCETSKTNDVEPVEPVSARQQSTLECEE